MQIVQIQKWLFTMLLIYPMTIICSRPMQRSSLQNNDYECRRSFNNILSDLRNNWQSPISYLQTRGYIPQNRDQTFNVRFRGRDEKLKGESGKLISKQAATGLNREEPDKDTSSNSAQNKLHTNAENSADNNIITNDVGANGNNNLNSKLNTHLSNNNFNTHLNTNNLNTNLNNNHLNTNFNTHLNTNNLNANLNNNHLNTNLDTHLNTHLNTVLGTNLNLNTELNTNHKIDNTFPTASSIARLNADTMSNVSPISNLNNSPNLINELNTDSNLNAYTDLNTDLNQPPTAQSSGKIDGKNANFLHSVKNKFLGFFRGKSDGRSANKKSAFTYDVYNDFSDSMPKELILSDSKLQDISKLYGKASDPEIERIIEKGLKKDNEYDKEFISSTANKDLLSRLGKYD